MTAPMVGRLARVARWAPMSALLLTAGAMAGPTDIGTGVFPDTGQIERSLVRGESTRADVQRLLGIPNGGGGALLPGHAAGSGKIEPYDIWYYEDIETGDIETEGNTMVMKMRQQILMIFFKEDRFHGYFWTSN